MTLPTALLLAMGLLGAADIWFFHTRAHALRTRNESRAELVTHALRGPTYGALFASVPNLELAGAWLGALFALLAFDLAISAVDFWLEPASRAGLGGLPRGEYLLHVSLAVLFGALVTSVLYEASDRVDAASAVRWLGVDEGPPLPLRIAVTSMAPPVLWTGALDLAAVLRLRSGRA
ncbi:MAG: hypothetical protein AAFP86_00770 [Planctomycetota bacterium]